MSQSPEIKARVTYSKTLQTRYIAHLDTIDIINKALRRLKLPYLVTQGCHIRPKISFGPPLPLGHSSQCEQFVLALSETVDANWLKTSLSEQLPVGMTVTDVEIPCAENKKGANGEIVNYRLVFTSKESAQKTLDFLSNPETSFTIMSKGKMRTYSIGNAVRSAKITEADSNTLLEAEFVQGLPDIPSVSKIITALADFLGNEKTFLTLIERISTIKL